MSSSRLLRVIALLVLLLVCAQCGPPFSCDECGASEACWEDEERCTDLCADRTTCRPGHDCVAVGELMACDLICDTALCPPTAVCGSETGYCVTVECSPTLACAEAGDACDLTNHDCYPVNGACGPDEECPQFGAVSSIGEITCGPDNFCHIRPWQIEPPWLDDFDDDLLTLSIAAPTPGHSFLDSASVELTWEDPAAPLIVYILTAVPGAAADVAGNAIWGAAIPEGGPRSVRLADGSAVVDGQWIGTRDTLPTDRPLYAFIFAIKRGRVVGLSLMIPFRVGSAWAVLDEPCQGAPRLPDDCASPAASQACRSGRCRRVCASHVDCADLALSCAEAIDGVRICE